MLLNRTFGIAARRTVVACCAMLLVAVAWETAWPQARAAPLDASVLSIAGRGATTYVLVSGVVGGVAQFRPLRDDLVHRGYRVVTVDPYRLSLDSADVTFSALAQRVDDVLARVGVDSARVVGHGHGAGVALRLAARNPSRVSALYFLAVGALHENRTRVFSSSLRSVPTIARIPGGRSYVRRQFVRGLRQNSGRDAWLDPATQREYTDPFLNHLSAAVAMAGRLVRAREPEPVAAVVSRVRSPVTLILGDAPHPSAPDPEEIEVLAPLGDRLRIERLPGVGHFPHREVPAEVAERIAREAPRN